MYDLACFVLLIMGTDNLGKKNEWMYHTGARNHGLGSDTLENDSSSVVNSAAVIETVKSNIQAYHSRISTYQKCLI